MNGKPWSERQLELLRRLFADMTTKDLAKIIGRAPESVNARAHKLKLRKSAAHLDSIESGRFKGYAPGSIATRFKKGQVPHNKGLRRPGWFRGRMKSTQFKKGGRPHNYVPVGTILPNSDGYLRRKIADPNVWEFVHRRVWEDAHGPIPHGMRLWWKDGNHSNCALENLELLNGAQHVARTTIQRFPPELKQAIYQLSGLKNHIRRREKRDGEKPERSTGAPVRHARTA